MSEFDEMMTPSAEVVKDSGDDSDDESESQEGSIQLGFLYKEQNLLFSVSDWRNWDGGKVGGKPVRVSIHIY
jgi:hypothetical protein